MADCDNSHLMNAVAQEYYHLMHIGISEGNCARFPGSGVLMPVKVPEVPIIQLIKDFKWANTFHNWTSYIIMMDETVSYEMENQLYDILSPGSSMGMLRLEDRSVKQCHVSFVMSHVSCVMCHVSCVMCDV